jgi:hypothetical protein
MVLVGLHSDNINTFWFVGTPRIFSTAKLSIRQRGSSSALLTYTVDHYTLIQICVQTLLIFQVLSLGGVHPGSSAQI